MSELGEMLRKAREKKGVSLAQVEEVTRIRQKFLRALEEGERDSLPEEVYVRAFLRSYARYLDLSPDEVISLYSGRERRPHKRYRHQGRCQLLSGPWTSRCCRPLG